MKKIIILCYCLLNTLFLAFSLNYGGSIDSYVKINGETYTDFSMINTNDGILWAKIPFDDYSKSYLAIEGKYRFLFLPSLQENQTQALSHYLDVNLFKFSSKIGDSNNSAEFLLGRFFVSDLTGCIVSQNCDGFFTKYSNKNFNCSLFTGYTGFLNSAFTSIYGSKYKTQDSLYSLSSKYLLAYTNVNFSRLFYEQSLGFELIGAYDFEANESSRAYTTLSLNGPLSNNFFYLLNSTLCLNVNSVDSSYSLSNLTKLTFSSFFTFANSSLTLTNIFATGKNETFGEFVPFTSQEASINQHFYSSLYKANICYTIKPVSNIFISLSSAYLANIMKNDTNFSSDGIQIELFSKWQIVSDAYMSINGGQFFTLNTTTKDYFFAKLSLGLTF